MFTLDGHPRGLNPDCMAFAPRGRPVLASGGHDGIKIWDLQQQRVPLHVIDTEHYQCNSLAFAADGERLVVVHDLYVTARIRIWEWTTGRLENDLSGGQETQCAVLAPDGERLASATGETTIRLWDLATGKYRRLQGHTDEVLVLAWSPDGKLLASAGLDHTARLWDVGTRTSTCRAVLQHRTDARGVAFAPDGRTLATIAGRMVQLWDVATGKRTANLRGHTRTVYGVGFTPGGRTLGTADEGGLVRLWDLATGKERAVLDWGIGKLHHLAFAPDGMLAAVAAANGRIVVWDVDEG
jgi:WD40 repeat protein